MNTVNAVLVKPDGTVVAVRYSRLRQLQALVGGFIEAISLPKLRAYAYVNENGISLGLVRNETATLACQMNGTNLKPGDFIKGPMVVVGPPDENGDDTDAPLEVWSYFHLEPLPK